MNKNTNLCLDVVRDSLRDKQRLETLKKML